jgi:hypothetical protein
MQQALKSPSRAARAQIAAAELLGKLDIAMNKPPTALHPGLRGENGPIAALGFNHRRASAQFKAVNAS